MKKLFNIYAIVWTLAFVIYNAVAFATVAGTSGFKVLSNLFWMAYAFIVVTFVLNLVISLALSKPNNTHKSFLNIPILYLSFSSLIVTTIVGSVTMAFSMIPWWIGFLVNMIVFAFYAFAIIAGNTAAGLVEEVEENVKAKTLFIKMLTTDAQSLVSKAVSSDAKASANKVYEAIRYSNPMSNDALASVESQITIKFSEYSNAVINDLDSVKDLEKELLILIEDRNNKCKILK